MSGTKCFLKVVRIKNVNYILSKYAFAQEWEKQSQTASAFHSPEVESLPSSDEKLHNHIL